MYASAEMGEVLLTARISDVLRNFILRIVARDVPLADQLGKGKARNFSEFGGFAEGENALGVERHSKLGPQTNFNLRSWKLETVGHGFRNIEMIGHALPSSFYYCAIDR